MKREKLRGFLGSAILGLTVVLTSCSSNNASTNESTEVMAKASYSCPMKCEGDKTYDKEGECPVCHMALTENEK